MALPFRPREYYGAVVKTLGKGVYGKVIMTDQNYAIKIIKNKDAYIGGSSLHEIVSLLKVESPYLIPLIDVIISDEDISLVLPLADATLDKTIGNPTLDIKSLMRQLCLGIADIHNADLLHLDVKPENLLLHKLSKERDYTDAQLWIADLGISRIHTCAFPPLRETFFSLWYRSPEILLGGPVTAKADVWAIGIVLTELLMSRKSKHREFLFPGNSETNQLELIFQLLGTPRMGVLTTLPNWKDDLPKWEINLRPYLKTYDMSDDEIDLIGFILNPDYTQRPSVFDVLQHSWFAPLQIPRQLTCQESLDIYSHYPSNRWVDLLTRQHTVEWMKETIDDFGSSYKSLSLAIYLLDRMMDIRGIPKDKIRLFASAALYISTIFYDSSYIDPEDLVDTNNASFTREDLTSTINQILTTTSFDLAVTTSYLYLSKYLLSEPPRLVKRARYIWVASLFTPSHFLHPSVTALAIIRLADRSMSLTDEAKQLYDQIMALPENINERTKTPIKNLQQILRSSLEIKG
jgi:serine/threonine protein kinase